MKKAFRITGIVLLVLLVLIVVAPFLFKGPIEKVVKKEINNLVDAQVDYKDFSLSLFSGFPNVRAELEGISVIGKGKFAGDTLAYVGNFSADIDIMSLFGDAYVVNSVVVEKPVVRAIVAADSSANWDIYISTDTAKVVEEVSADTTSAMKLNLNDVTVVDADIAYVDSTSNIFAHLKDIDLGLKGTVEGDVTNVDLALDVAGIDVAMEGVKYLNGSTVDFDAAIIADLAQNKYTFAENKLNFSGVPLSFDGYAQLKDNSTAVNIKLAASETSFKTLLALIPEYIMKDVPGLKMDGTFELYADVKGEYVDMEHIPSLDVAFRVNNGVIKYPDLPKSLNAINVDVAAKNPGGSADLTTVDVSKLHFELGSNPFDAKLNVVTPISNATFSAKVDGVIDLNSLKDALPLDSMSVAGIVNAKLQVATNMKAIEKEDYANVAADGLVTLKEFSFESSDFPQGVKVTDAKLVFTPKLLDLNRLDVVIGQTDISAKGKVENYIPYVLSDGTIKGSLSVASNYINCNELLGGESSATPVDTVSAAPAGEVGAVEVPKNIDFVINADVKKILYDKLTIDNIKGGVVVKDGIAKLSKVTLDMCEGVISLDGSYNTANIEKPGINMAIGMDNVDVNSLTNSFSVVDSLLPIAKSAYGKVSVNMTLVGDLDQTMSPVIKTLNGKGSFKSQSLSLKESDFQKKLSKLLANDKYEDLTMKSFKGAFAIKDGSIVVEPFDISMFNKKTQFGGSQGLDKTMDYVLTVPLTRAEVMKLVNLTGANFSSEGSDLPVGIKVGGTLTSPKLGLDVDGMKASLLGEAKNQAKEKVNEVVEEVKDKAKEEVKEKLTEELNKNENVKKAKDEAKDALNNLFKKKKK